MSETAKNVEKLVRRLNAAIRGLPQYTLKGLLDAAKIVKRDCEITPPLTPLDTGNLRASFFVTSWIVDVGGWGTPYVALGYTAYYAPYVHEKTGESVEWSRPGSGPRWFEQALRRNTRNILERIAHTSRLKIRG